MMGNARLRSEAAVRRLLYTQNRFSTRANARPGKPVAGCPSGRSRAGPPLAGQPFARHLAGGGGGCPAANTLLPDCPRKRLNDRGRNASSEAASPCHITGVNGIAGFRYAAIETCAAVRLAVSKKARAAGDSGSLTTSGSPMSPPILMGW